MYSIILLKLVSIKKMIREIIIEAIITTTPLLCSSLQVGQLTLFLSSSVDSSIYVLIFDIYFILKSTSGSSTFSSQHLLCIFSARVESFGFLASTFTFVSVDKQGKLLVSAPFCALFQHGWGDSLRLRSG